jgi:hypothetical protein
MYRDFNQSRRGRRIGRGANRLGQNTAQTQRSVPFDALQPTTHTNILGARQRQSTGGHENSSNTNNEAEGGEQPVQPQYTNTKGIVEKSDKNATSHLRGTINREEVIEKPLCSVVVARANTPRGNITNKGTKIATRPFNFVGKSLPPCGGKGIKKTVVPPSKPYNSSTASESNFGGKPPPWHAKGIGRTVVPPPKPDKKSMIEGGSNDEILESIIQDARGMPREVPPPPILPPPILRPVKQLTIATASQQKSSQCSGETITWDNSREGSASHSIADDSPDSRPPVTMLQSNSGTDELVESKPNQDTEKFWYMPTHT